MQSDDFDAGFIGTNKSEIEQMTDLALAEWQSGWKPGTAKHILPDKEWQRRLFLRQLQEQFKLDARLAQANISAMRFAAIIGVVGTLAGACLGAFATFETGISQTTPIVSHSNSKVPNEFPKNQSIPTIIPASSAGK